MIKIICRLPSEGLYFIDDAETAITVLIFSTFWSTLTAIVFKIVLIFIFQFQLSGLNLMKLVVQCHNVRNRKEASKVQKENQAGCAGEGKQSKGN